MTTRRPTDPPPTSVGEPTSVAELEPQYARWLHRLAAREASESPQEASERAAWHQEASDRETRRQRELMRSSWVGAGVPKRLVTWIEAHPEPCGSAMVACREFLTSGLEILVLAGPPGCGKTTAAAWAVTQHGRALMVDVARLARTNRYDEGQMGRLETVALLVIDDLGMEAVHDRSTFPALVDGLVNARYAGARKTIVTTNLPAAEFRSAYGERIVDRIRECGRYVEISDPSYRRRQK